MNRPQGLRESLFLICNSSSLPMCTYEPMRIGKDCAGRYHEDGIDTYILFCFKPAN